MSAIVIPFRTCNCGKPGMARSAECGELKANFIACDECLERSTAFLARVRPIFEAMRTVGVPGNIANETMSFLLDQIPDDAMLEKRS